MKEIERAPLENILRSILPSSYFRERMIMDDSQMKKAIEVVGKGIEYPHCRYIHPHTCEIAIWSKMVNSIKKVGSLYVAIILILYYIKTPKGEKMKRENLVQLVRRVCQSLMFVGGFGLLYKTSLCYGPNIMQLSPISSKCMFAFSFLPFLLDSRWIWADLSIFMLPKLMETRVNSLHSMKWNSSIPLISNIILSLSIGVSSLIYYTDHTCIRRSSYRMINRILGDIHDDDHIDIQ